MRIKELFTASNFVHLSIFIFFVFGMIFKTSYSVTTVSLLLISIYIIVRYRQDIDFKKGHPIAVVFLLYACTVTIVNLFGWHDARDYEPPLRFFLAVPIVYAMTYIKINRLFIMVCIAIGGIAMSVLAVYQVYELNFARAGVYYIRFGNIGILTAFFCLASFLFIPQNFRSNQQLLLKLLLCLGIVGGVISSVLSETRGGWVLPIFAIPFILFLLFKHSKRIIRDITLMALACSVVMAGLYFTPLTGIQKRISQAITEVEKYGPNQSSSRTSVGARLEMWRLVTQVIQEKPYVGWGVDGYRDRMKQFVQEKQAKSTILHRHPHNEILNEASKRGVFAALWVILGFYIFYFANYSKRLNHPDIAVRYYATLGCLVIMGWFSFGLTDVFLEHSQTISYFIVYMSVFWGGLVQSEKQSQTSDNLSLTS
ncbi:O-antigen ligase [Pelistega sp. MC2]|uniref:O-antigen ligase family protein n=1 Tax=Pelistega sp. MC2 TaxID=1720297 RepID=UPI0009F4E144|nr:O-antigen ligase family protein [Pelistega sp. MC2]